MWVRVTRSEPCVICGKSSFCTRSADGTVAHCQRVESAKPSNGPLGGWIHKLTEALPVIDSARLPSRAKPEVDWGDVAQSMFESLTAAEERDYLARSLGLKQAALVELQVGRGWDEWRGQPYSSWPERDATGKVVGIVRRYRDGTKKTMRHSSHGLYFAAPIVRMRKGPVFLVEGGSDTAALLGIGLNVVGRPSNMGGVKMLAELLAKVRNTLIVVGERDNKPKDRCAEDCHGCLLCWPGLAGARETASRLGEMLNRKVVWLLPAAKDARAWLKERPSTGLEFLAAAAAWRAESAALAKSNTALRVRSLKSSA